MTTQGKGVRKQTIVFAVIIIIIVVGISGTGYYLTHTYTNPVTILSEELDLPFAYLLVYEQRYPIVIDSSSTQIQITLEITSGSLIDCYLRDESSDEGIYGMTNGSELGIGLYTSDWINLSPGNYSVAVEWGLPVQGNLTVLSRHLLWS